MTTPQPRSSGRFGRAVVGLHRTEQDAGLLAYAAMLVRAGIVTDVVCIHVLPDAKARDDSGEQFLAAMKADADRLLGSTAKTTLDLRAGPLLDQLLAAVAEHQADVVLIGHRQDHPMKRSLARRLAKLAPCSVWLVPDDTPAAITQMLVPIDFSAAAGFALETAAGLAARLGLAEIMALHIYFDESRTTYEGKDAAIRGREQGAFEAFMKSHDTAGVRVSPLFLEGIHPADTIRRVADERATDLVVMGTRGRSPSAGVLLGSVAQETLIASRVPVLVVRSPGRHVGVFRALMQLLWRHEPGQFD